MNKFGWEPDQARKTLTFFESIDFAPDIAAPVDLHALTSLFLYLFCLGQSFFLFKKAAEKRA
jgi:hypothetical protein